MRRLGVGVCVLLIPLLLGCKPEQRGSRAFGRTSPLRQAARRILRSEEFPEPAKQERALIERQIANLKNASRYESEKVGMPSRTSRHRISCQVLADFGRSAVPFLLRALDDRRPTANLYVALALQHINPRIARTIWIAMEQDRRNVPCMKGRRFYSVTVGEIARQRGAIPDRNVAD